MWLWFEKHGTNKNTSKNIIQRVRILILFKLENGRSSKGQRWISTGKTESFQFISLLLLIPNYRQQS